MDSGFFWDAPYTPVSLIYGSCPRFTPKTICAPYNPVRLIAQKILCYKRSPLYRVWRTKFAMFPLSNFHIPKTAVRFKNTQFHWSCNFTPFCLSYPLCGHRLLLFIWYIFYMNWAGKSDLTRPFTNVFQLIGSRGRDAKSITSEYSIDFMNKCYEKALNFMNKCCEKALNV